MLATCSTSVHVNCFLYFLWHTWRVSYFEGWTQTLTRVYTVVKSTSTWSASPGLYLLTYTWCTLRHRAMAGKHKDFVTSLFWTDCVQIFYVYFCWLLSAGNWYICSEQAQQRARMISSHVTIWWGHLRTTPPQAPAQLIIQSVWIIVLSGTLHTKSSSSLSIGRRCRL